MNYKIEKNTVQETLIIPLYARMHIFMFQHITKLINIFPFCIFRH